MKVYLSILIILLLACESRKEQTTFILVRHAEKANDGTEDPPLTPEGEARARRLAYMLKDTPLAAIYSTNFRRTRSTAQPVADLKNLPVKTYEAHQPDVIGDILRENQGATVLITGHSNTIPWTANLLIGTEVYKDYVESEYGIMLIVTVVEGGKGTALRVNY